MTDQPKWTPGPWRVLNDEAIKVASSDGSLATVTHIHLRGRRDTSEVEANAHLIAAAPDMAEALEKALNFITNTESEMGETLPCGDAARAALAKARGETK